MLVTDGLKQNFFECAGLLVSEAALLIYKLDRLVSICIIFGLNESSNFEAAEYTRFRLMNWPVRAYFTVFVLGDRLRSFFCD